MILRCDRELALKLGAVEVDGVPKNRAYKLVAANCLAVIVDDKPSLLVNGRGTAMLWPLLAEATDEQV